MLCDVIIVLLSLQFFSSSELLPDNLDIIHILMGVGQGLVHAGDVADWLWYLGVERPFALKSSELRQYGISRYDRFRDDIMIASGDGPEIAAYVQGISTHALDMGYILKLEYSELVVPFLDIEITITDRGSYKCAQYVKPGAVENTPLDDRSGQPYHVHTTSPLSALTRGVALGSSPSVVASRIAARCHAHALPAPEAVVHAASTNRIPRKPKVTVRTSPVSMSRPAVTRCSWVPMGYHPRLASPLSQALRDLSNDAEWLQLYRTIFRSPAQQMRCAWRNPGKRHELLVRKLTAKRKVSDVGFVNVESAEMPRKEVGAWLEAPVVVAITAAAGATATASASSTSTVTTPEAGSAGVPATVAAVKSTALSNSDFVGRGRRLRPFRYPER